MRTYLHNRNAWGPCGGELFGFGSRELNALHTVTLWDLLYVLEDSSSFFDSSFLVIHSPFCLHGSNWGCQSLVVPITRRGIQCKSGGTSRKADKFSTLRCLLDEIHLSTAPDVGLSSSPGPGAEIDNKQQKELNLRC